MINYFRMYTSWAKVLMLMDDADAGALMKCLLAYAAWGDESGLKQLRPELHPLYYSMRTAVEVAQSRVERRQNTNGNAE